MIRVAILSDRRTRSQSVAEMLEEDDRLEVVTDHADADVILSVGFPMARIPDEGPPLVAIGVETDAFAMADNVRASLPANSSDAEIVAALIAAEQNLTVLTASQAKKLFRHSKFDEERNPLVEQLTPREMEVLHMLAAGIGNKEIAANLRISPHTAKFHVAQILAKLDAGSRTEAVSLGIRLGLIPV